MRLGRNLQNNRDFIGCTISGKGHSIPSGPMAMRPAGAKRIACQVEFVEGFTFAITSENGLELLKHHAPVRLRAALASDALVGIELIPKFELLVVTLTGRDFPIRFYMTSGELEPCSR
jgi:hypothetical protein